MIFPSPSLIRFQGSPSYLCLRIVYTALEGVIPPSHSLQVKLSRLCCCYEDLSGGLRLRGLFGFYQIQILAKSGFETSYKSTFGTEIWFWFFIQSMHNPNYYYYYYLLKTLLWFLLSRSNEPKSHSISKLTHNLYEDMPPPFSFHVFQVVNMFFLLLTESWFNWYPNLSKSDLLPPVALNMKVPECLS